MQEFTLRHAVEYFIQQYGLNALFDEGVAVSRPFTLYWSSIENYEACPQKFLWSRGWEGVDCGGGPGRRKPIPEEMKTSRHHSLMGTVIQGVIEDMYNQNWIVAYKGSELTSLLQKETDARFEKEIAKEYIIYGGAFNESPPESELRAVCHAGVQGFLRTLKHHRLWSPESRCEVNLLGYVDDNSPVAGRADFLILRSEDEQVSPGVTFLDGKNSMNPGKYTNPDQLRWYALCYYLMHRELPSRLGFVYFRFPAGSSEHADKLDHGIDWVDLNMNHVVDLANRAKAAYAGMRALKFEPNPTPKVCNLCDYSDLCDARQAQLTENRKKRGINPPSKEGLAEIERIASRNTGKVFEL